MLINFDCSCLWYDLSTRFKIKNAKFYIFLNRVKDKYAITQALSVDPVYLQYVQMDKAIDYRVKFKILIFFSTIKT